MKRDEVIMHPEIRHILRDMQTGDWLAVYSKGLYGFGIRHMLSRGRHRCITNHNAPCWRTDSGTPMMLQIAPPKARTLPLCVYLTDLYAKGGKAILLRPDAYKRPYGGDERRFNQALCWLTEEWKSFDGIPYDKASILEIAKMYLRLSGHKADNDKTRIYCTEGTFYPYANNPFVPWTPDILVNESFPAPIHAEHLIRQERVEFVAGAEDMYKKIMES